MGHPVAMEPHSGWRPPSRIASLDDYLRKPKRRSKLSKELQEYEEGEAVQDKILQLETTSPRSTIDSRNTNLCNSATQEEVKPFLLQDHTSSSLEPSNPGHIHPLPPKPLLEPTSLLFSTLPPPNSDPLTYFHTLSLHRYLTNLQDPHGPLAAQYQQNLINQQAIRDQTRLSLGLEPRSYQAKGRVLAVYDCGDGLGGKAGAAIEVIHAPLGFPNQEVWLWEMRRDCQRSERVREGNVVLFRIVWGAAENHWEVVDVGG